MKRRRCHLCGEQFDERELQWAGLKGRYGIYQCKSLSICKWRRKRNFDKRQMQLWLTLPEDI